jgi:Uma2 family endonuclease
MRVEDLSRVMGSPGALRGPTTISSRSRLAKTLPVVYDTVIMSVGPITTAEQLFEANLRHCELVRGELITMAPVGFDHGGIAGNIALALGGFAKPKSLGMVATAETGFRISRDPDTVRAPDVAFVRAERIPRGGVKGFFQGPPDIAVEVVSPTDRASEVLAKVQDWLQAGCGLVWVVDPETRTVTVYRSRSEVAVLTVADTLFGGDVLPGFAVPVAEIFA